MQAKQNLLMTWPPISVAYSRRKSRSEGGLRASCGPLKLGPPLQTGLSGAEVNLPEASSYPFCPAASLERGLLTETC